MSIIYSDRLVWKGGKRKAFTLSYDDGVTQDERLIGILDRYGVKCTFNLNPALFGKNAVITAGKKEALHNKFDISRISEIYANHEVAGHGNVHCILKDMDMPRCMEEILGSRRELEKIFRHPVTGFAYSFGVYDDRAVEALASCGISYARTVERTGKFDIPEDFLRWHPTCHHNDVELERLTEEFLSDSICLSMYAPAKLFYVWGHSYEFDQDENWGRMESFISKVSGHDDVWYASNGEVCDYVRAFEKLIYTLDGKYVYNPTATTLYVGEALGAGFVEVKSGETVEVAPAIEM